MNRKPLALQAPSETDANRSLRVLHVVEAFGGGVLEVLDSLTSRLSDAGHLNAVAYGVRPETPSDVRERFDRRVELIRMDWGTRAIIETLRVLKTLPRIALSWEPDVIHLHSSFAGATGALVLTKRWPVIYSPHGYAFAVPRSKPTELAVVAAERFVALRVSLVGAVSASEGQDARLRAHARRVVVVPNGIPDLDEAGRVSTHRHKERRVVAAGRPVPQRQPVQVAQILQGVREEAEVAWIGGGYEDSAEVDALLRAEIPLTGWLARTDALEEVNRAMVYLHWTAWDGLALSILEAMARDVVVVAHDVPSSREVLGPEQVCRDVDEAVEMIRRVLRDPHFRETLLATQRLRARAFSADQMARRWLEVYGTAAARS